MHRLDHSGLGAHPGRISYSNSGTYFGEDITIFSLQYNKQFTDHLSLLVNGTTNIYKVDNASSYIGIDHDLSTGTNYMYGESLDLRLEPIVSYNKERITVLGGTLFTNSSGISFQNFMNRPYLSKDKLTIDGDGNYWVSNSMAEGTLIDSLFPLTEFSFNTFSAFSQFFYKGEKLNILAGFRYEVRSDVGDAFSLDTGALSLGTSVDAFNPSIGALYRITENISVRGSYAQAFQTPGPFYQANNYEAREILDEMGEPTGMYEPFRRRTIILSPEYLETVSGGIDYYFKERSGKIGLSYFRNKLENSLFTENKTPGFGPPPPNGFFVGYINRNTESILNGFQLSYFKDFNNLSVDLHSMYYIGHEEIEDISELDSYRSVPTYEFKGNVKYRFLKKNSITCNVQVYGPFVNRVIFAQGQLFENITGASYNVDLYLNRKFTKNLTASFKVNNLLNSVNKGVFNNWFDGYDFNYVPQLQRWFFINLSYSLN